MEDMEHAGEDGYFVHRDYIDNIPRGMITEKASREHPFGSWGC